MIKYVVVMIAVPDYDTAPELTVIRSYDCAEIAIEDSESLNRECCEPDTTYDVVVRISL